MTLVATPFYIIFETPNLMVGAIIVANQMRSSRMSQRRELLHATRLSAQVEKDASFFRLCKELSKVVIYENRNEK